MERQPGASNRPIVMTILRQPHAWVDSTWPSFQWNDQPERKFLLKNIIPMTARPADRNRRTTLGRQAAAERLHDRERLFLSIRAGLGLLAPFLLLAIALRRP